MVRPLKIEALFELIAQIFLLFEHNDTAVIQARTGLQGIAISNIRVL